MVVGLPALSLLLPAIFEEIATAGGTSEVTRIAAAITKFLLFYSGVFALIGLTAAVGAGVLAGDRIMMTPAHRIVAQALHRTTSLLAIAALANHIMLEVMAQRVHPIDGFIPFMSSDRTFFMGLGTIASDLLLLIMITGLLRGRFTTGRRPQIWRLLHTTAYACWPLAVLHGLLAGRSAKPYVDWSYGGLLAIVAGALALRRIMGMRGPGSTPAGADLARTPLPPRAPGAELLGQITAGVAPVLPAPTRGRAGLARELAALPPGQYLPPGRYADDPYQRPYERYPDERYPDERYPDEQYPDTGYGPGDHGRGNYEPGGYGPEGYGPGGYGPGQHGPGGYGPGDYGRGGYEPGGYDSEPPRQAGIRPGTGGRRYEGPGR
ncbi:MAG TPA: hypothetical protein VGI58_12650 [Streptosporangiaceae bacterium]